jgi:hypothetical protein
MLVMSRDESEDIQKRPGWLIPLAVFLVVAALSAILMLYYLVPSGPNPFQEQITPTSNGDKVTLSVQGRRFYIPANYLQYESARRGGEHREIAMFATLPDLNGWSNWQTDSFNDNTADSTVVTFLIREEKSGLTEVGKLKRVYMGYVRDAKGKPGPFGLTQYEFRPDTGYRDEDLYIGQAANGTTVLRCERLSAEVPSPKCLRDETISNGLALTYRFKRVHLAKWRVIADGVDKLMVSFRQAPKK